MFTLPKIDPVLLALGGLGAAIGGYIWYQDAFGDGGGNVPPPPPPPDPQTPVLTTIEAQVSPATAGKQDNVNFIFIAKDQNGEGMAGIPIVALVKDPNDASYDLNGKLDMGVRLTDAAGNSSYS